MQSTQAKASIALMRYHYRACIMRVYIKRQKKVSVDIHGDMAMECCVSEREREKPARYCHSSINIADC
jgi:hypothetical protein